MTTTRIILSVLAALLGVFFFIFGGYDDSPGAQGLGLLIFIGAVVSFVRARRKA